MQQSILSRQISSKAISALETHKILYNNWNIECDVKAAFAIQNDENNIYLEFKVEESDVKARYKNFNEPVYEDSCVEFFVSFDGQNYYNLEFNCIGNILGAYGSERNMRKALDDELLENIKTCPSLGFNKIEITNRRTEWTLSVTIPKETFCYDNIKSYSGLKAKGNFYKCGDKLIKPHFLSWNPIHSEQPDFHLPEYFGDLEFG